MNTAVKLSEIVIIAQQVKFHKILSNLYSRSLPNVLLSKFPAMCLIRKREREGERGERTYSDLSTSQRVSSPETQGLLGDTGVNMGSNSRYFVQWPMRLSTAMETWTRGSLE